MNKHNIYKFIILTFIIIALPFSIYLLNQETYFLNKAYTIIFGAEARITVNLTDPKSISFYPWSNLAQGGEEKTNALLPVSKNISLLEPGYIRIDHIYDFYDVVERDSEGELTYDWTKLDSVILTILTTGAKPFISLSYMPKTISSGSEVDTPLDWNEWREIVKETIRHISGKDGLAIDGVYYEVWNEPDLFGRFRLWGNKNYLDLYFYAASGVQEANNVLPFKFGGTATTQLYRNWFYNFLEFVRKNNLRLDFYSWHRYSKNIQDYEEDITNAKTWILDFPEFKDIEFIISEAGFDSNNNSDYDTDFSAIHTISMYAAAFSKMEKIFSFEIKDGLSEKKYWGGLGILTHESFGEPLEKPRYRAFEFLNKMKGAWYPVYGNGSWVKSFATTDGKVIRTLIVNYDPLSKHFENVPINFVNLPSHKFTFRRIDFLGETIEYVVEIEDKNFSTLQMLKPNSASIFEIIPYQD